MSSFVTNFFNFFSAEETFPEKTHTEEINGEEWTVYEFTPGYSKAAVVNEISVPTLKESQEHLTNLQKSQEVPFAHDWEELEMDLPKSSATPSDFLEMDEEDFERFVNDPLPPPVRKEEYTLSRFIQMFNQYVQNEIESTPTKSFQQSTIIEV